MESVNYRYAEQDAVIPSFSYKRQFRNEAKSLTSHLAEVANAIRCFDYQACEHPGWESSVAHSFLQGLRETVLSNLQTAEGVDYESSQGEWRPAA